MIDMTTPEKENELLSYSPEERRKLLKRRDMTGRGGTIGPMILWNMAFFMFPLIYILFISFCQRNAFGQIKYDLTFDNYRTFFTGTYMQVMLKSIKMAFEVTIIVILIAYPYAYFVSKLRRKTQSLLMLLIMIPSWTNSLLRVYALMNIMSTSGLINNMLIRLGIISEPIQMLYTDFAVYLGMIFTTLPFMILPLYSNLQKMDRSVLEAGRDLGCSSFQLFWRVIFPISLPGLAGGIALVFIPAMANFFIADLMGGGKSINIGNVIQNQFSTSNNWPLGSAISVILMIVSAVLVSEANRLAESGGHAAKSKK